MVVEAFGESLGSPSMSAELRLEDDLLNIFASLPGSAFTGPDLFL